MVISNEFENAIRTELVKSELKRLTFISAILGIVFFNLVFISNLFYNFFKGFFTNDWSYYILNLWISFFFAFEIFQLFRLKSKVKKFGNPSVNPSRYSLFVEITYLNCIIFLILWIEQKPVLIDSPIIFFLILLLILSALRLDFDFSVLCGFIAALEFLIVTIYALEILEVSHDYILKLPKITYYFRSVYLFITGITAGFIAREMKRGIYKSFDNMFEKRRMESLFGQQVEPEVVKTLLQESEKSKITQVTILFFDIRNFTSFADIRTPEEIISFQNHLFGPIVNIIHKHHGIVNQILGDGIMATFGAPVKLPDHSQKAFNASLDILKQTEELYASGVIPEIKIGMGLHSGPVVAGNIGDDSRKQYSISGTTVIIAARIEQLNKKYGTSILVSDAVKNQIKTERELISLGVEKLKGLEKGIEIFMIG